MKSFTQDDLVRTLTDLTLDGISPDATGKGVLSDIRGGRGGGGRENKGIKKEKTKHKRRKGRGVGKEWRSRGGPDH